MGDFGFAPQDKLPYRGKREFYGLFRFRASTKDPSLPIKNSDHAMLEVAKSKPRSTHHTLLTHTKLKQN
ncbi:hypothetical protein J6590_003380 [Homalodisca vitripennis]|nr:hypothetical protein J6590_003380 [Homalodisca vitripennis]